MTQVNPIRMKFKSINIQDFFTNFQNYREADCIAFLKNYKLQDLVFLRGFVYPGKTVVSEYYRYMEDKNAFVKSIIELNKLNLLQLALHYNFSNLVRYIITEHKVLSSKKQTPKSIDPRIILMGTEQDNDETFSLRLAISNVPQAFFMFWNDFPFLYDERHMMTIARFLLFNNKMEMIEQFLQSETTQMLFRNAPRSIRDQFLELFIGQNIAPGILQAEPFSMNDELDLDEDQMRQIYNFIKDNDVDRLKDFCESQARI